MNWNSNSCRRHSGAAQDLHPTQLAPSSWRPGRGATNRQPPGKVSTMCPVCDVTYLPGRTPQPSPLKLSCAHKRFRIGFNTVFYFKSLFPCLRHGRDKPGDDCSLNSKGILFLLGGGTFAANRRSLKGGEGRGEVGTAWNEPQLLTWRLWGWWPAIPVREKPVQVPSFSSWYVA
jgi:hypothetical protein